MEHGVLLDFKNRGTTCTRMLWLLVIGGITTFVQFGSVGMQKAWYAEGKQATAAEIVKLVVS